jgi:hypothetical protein
VSVRFLADENFNNRIVLGLRRNDETIDIALVQEVGLRTADDATVLAWAADAGRVLLTHDIATIPGYAHERVSAGLPMPGVLVVGSAMPIAPVIEEVLLIAGASEPDEWKDSVRYLPLR